MEFQGNVKEFRMGLRVFKAVQGYPRGYKGIKEGSKVVQWGPKVPKGL